MGSVLTDENRQASARAGGGDSLRSVAVLTILAFVLVAAPFLERLSYRFDEGVYIAQAELLSDGEIPHKDFFLHQPPLYPATLSALVWGSPTSLFPYRLVSLLVTAIAGWLVFLMARQALSAVSGLVALALFLSHPLQYFGMIAYPNAFMVLLAAAGFFLAVFSSRIRHAALAGGCLALSVLFKPVSLATLLAVVVTLLVSPQGRRRLPALLATLMGVGLSVFGFLMWISQGGFAQLLHLQVLRLAQGRGFELMQGMERFQGIMDGAGVSSALEWNLSRCSLALLSTTDGGLFFTLLAVAGLLCLWIRPTFELRWLRVPLTCWLVMPLLFSLFFWDPAWNHYFLECVPAHSLLGAVVVWRVWQLSFARILVRSLAVLGLGVVLATGPAQMRSRLTDLAWNGPHPEAGQKWLMLDPTMNILSGSEPACGIVDPFNVYGENAFLAGDFAGALGHFHVDVDELIQCLENDPGIQIALGDWGGWFVDEKLQLYLDSLPPERFVASLEDGNSQP